MPGRDGTGPLGAGSMTGRGQGLCPSRAVGTRLGRKQGFGCGFGNMLYTKVSKEQLIENKSLLQNQIKLIDKQLENM